MVRQPTSARACVDARRPFLRTLALSLACAAVPLVPQFASTALAQADKKPIRIVVAYATGGSVDLAARRIADDLARELGQPVVIENKPGANGIPASEFVKNAAPDGTTVLFTTVPAHAGNKSAYKKLPYDTMADFTPVTVMSVIPLVLVAHPSLPANSIEELIKLCRERPGKINYASFGVGGMAHLAGVQLALLGKCSMNHVPYKGGGPALADVLGGHVDLYFSGVMTALPLVQEGKLKALAVSSSTRLTSLPKIPAVAENPGFENFEAVVSPIMLVPAKTPPESIARLQAAVAKVTGTPKYRAALENAGEGDPRATTPQQAADMVNKESERLAGLFKAAGMQPE